MNAKQRYLLKRIHAVLSNGRRVELNGRIRALGYCDTEHIWLNPKGDILPTLLHEALHILYPDKIEESIIIMERSLSKSMSDRQWRNLLKKLSTLT